MTNPQRGNSSFRGTDIHPVELPRNDSGTPSGDSEQERRRQGYMLVGAAMSAGVLVGAVQQAQRGAGTTAVLMGAACAVCLAATELSRRGRLKVAATVFLVGIIALGLPGYLAQV
ncbi:hypothetical protein [Streptomyces sp. cg35]|uniref:hypothetical protein n=1 Tax=Streptomyces sp. cg35 TaxID=3421650 RepID=UPI003D175C50